MRNHPSPLLRIACLSLVVKLVAAADDRGGARDESSEPAGTHVRHYAGAREMADAWVQEWGFRDGARTRTTPIFVAVASVRLGANDANYPRACDDAFATAVSDCKAQAAKYLNSEVERTLKLKDELVEVIGNPALAEALTGASSDAAFRSQEHQASLVRVGARASLAGFTTLQSFIWVGGPPERLAEVAVVCALSVRTIAALNCQSSAEDLPSVPLGEWFASIPPDTLARTFGIRMKCDERRMRIPIYFSRIFESEVPERLAEGKAATRAQGELAALRGEAVASGSTNRLVQEFIQSAGRDDDLKIESRFESEVDLQTTQSLGSVRELGRRKVTDPDSGRPVTIVAFFMTPCAERPASGNGAGPAQPGAREEACDGCPDLPAEMQARTRQVCATGEGVSRTAALKSALLSAVSQEGAFIQGEGRLQDRFAEAMRMFDGQLDRHLEVHTQHEHSVTVIASGFVHSFSVLDDRQIGDSRHEVRVCANLIRFDPKDRRFGAPATLAVVVDPSSRFTRGGVADPHAGEAASRMVTSSLELVVAESGRFTLIDEAHSTLLAEYRNEVTERVRRGESSALEVQGIGRRVSADFLLVVTIDAQFSGRGDGVLPTINREDGASAQLRASIVDVSTGERSWTSLAQIDLNANALLNARAGHVKEWREDEGRPPLMIVCNRGGRKLASDLREEWGLAVRPQADGGLQVERVLGDEVTLSGGINRLRVGMRLAVLEPVATPLPGRKVVVDRDEVAVLMVTQLLESTAIARVVGGDASLIRPQRSQIEVLEGP